jgi:8-oxo-dGTP diphosphatase/2-hydroxy-dATP diphosphatase
VCLISKPTVHASNYVSAAQEEAGIQAPLDHCGTLLFLTQSIEWAFQIEIYRAETYTGELIE